MKKLLLSIIVALSGVCAFAQQGQMAAGVNISYTPCLESGMSINNFGVSAKFQYSFSKVVRGELLTGFDFKNKEVALFHASENFHFIIRPTEKLKVYPIVGFGYALIIIGSDNDSNYMINGGLGAEYDITNNLSAGIEVKYQYIEEFSRLPISLGVTYKF